MNDLNQLVRESVAYDADTGALTWLVRPAAHFATPAYQGRWNRMFAGQPAFASRHCEGYRHGTLAGRALLAHRVAWFLLHGEWPQHEIDHANGQKDDNRSDNLRAATAAQNKANRAKYAGASRYKGVAANGRGAFTAYIGSRATFKHLGTFRCETAAAIARMKAAKATYGEFASHG